MTEMAVQIITAFIGSFGFAVFFRMKGKQILLAAAGGAATWAVYLMVAVQAGGYFIPNVIAAIFAAIYAEIMARVNKAPATIFLTAAAVPLVPGGRLYYTMAGLVNSDKAAFAENGEAAVTIALAIALGFVIVALGSKYFYMFMKRKPR
ncbi:MAG: threonine/serine exporter family protein [Firmicutes bacterium]|nr:threonine/serine exporter family protein [Bacillota bacterium]